ncbi:MAG: beta/gamma crystallin-related protein, partial [Mucilaginibacter sp.]
DQVSSFIVVSGKWQFYEDINFGKPTGPVFGPGYYEWVEKYGIRNDSVSSFKCVELT